MKLLSSKDLSSLVQNIIHEDTQLHTHNIDLTVSGIHQFAEAGALDFGGSEFEAAASQSIDPKKKNSDDKYGWWKLEGGSYKALFNEELVLGERHIALISLHKRAYKTGLTGNTGLITQKDNLELVFCVPTCGSNIKENARIASLFVFALS